MPDRQTIPLKSALLFKLSLALLVNKSGAICKFLSCVTATQHSMPPVIRFVL
ncbi:hypothetical protein P262_01740 [Cronobacter malonaticus]|uniref:Uncharacterized protein n=1 Tax=Cronobacter malonaticus TaxID=413503 RepID=V5TWV2_9ENTR|nr:hypothetical protein P262_01740 [Cronobacter malonaticus]EGL72461.1 hypothetical protein CSE899_11794 [Cronobacter sakazakii E899]SPW23509.1 Uncharacterised protein [Cronobacter sakazakii]